MEERPEEGAGEEAEQPSPAPADDGGTDAIEQPPTEATAEPRAPGEPAAPARQAAAPSSGSDLESLVPPVFRDKYETAQKEEQERAAAEAEARAEQEVRLAEEARLAEKARIAEEARAAEERAAAEAAAAEAAARGEGEDVAPADDAEDTGADADAEAEEGAQPAGLGDDMVTAPAAQGRVPWWPFLVYLVAWIALIATAAFTISYETDAPPAFEQEYYAYILLGGLVLTIAGPLVSLLVWFVARYRTPKGERSGLFASSLIKGASVTVFGVLAWWGALVLLDAIRLGMVSGIT